MIMSDLIRFMLVILPVDRISFETRSYEKSSTPANYGKLNRLMIGCLVQHQEYDWFT